MNRLGFFHQGARLLAAAIVALGLGLPLAADAASVLPHGLDKIVKDARIAFQGRCLERWSERDAQSGMIVTYTKFLVSDRLKGHVEDIHTIKQIGGRVGDEAQWVDGIPGFTQGEEYVVFLYGVSKLGFSSPVGLSQGRFQIGRKNDERVIGNGHDLSELLADLPERELPPSARANMKAPPGQGVNMELNEFKQLVRGRAGQ